MRIQLFVTLLFATTTAFATDLTFEQASALANKDVASLNGDQTLALAQSQSKASSVALAKCPQPTRSADYASFVIVMELDASGKATRTWLQGSTAAAVCFNETMSHETYFKPPHAPFYASYDMFWQH
jgi:hypothetical protein